MHKHFLLFLLLNIISVSILSQNQFVFNTNTNVYARIMPNAYLVITNPNPSGIATSSVANIISEGETNALKWMLGNNTGNYVVPFTTNSLVKIPLQVNITNAGLGGSNAGIVFSTYETNTDQNSGYPSDVTNLNSNCKDSVGLNTVDRFWRIEAENYTTKPTPVINFGFDNSPNEIGVSNTINIGALKAMRFNNTNNSWETPQKLYGIANSTLANVNSVNVSATDFYKSWTLIDSSILNLPVAITSGSALTICNGNQAVINASGATSYTLIPDNIISNGTFSVAPNINTLYSVIGSIGSGTNSCTSYTSSASQVLVNVNPLPIVSTQVTNIKCNGDSNGTVTASVTTAAAYGYLWSNGATTGLINNMGAGVYTLTIIDVNNCKATHTTTITEPAPLTITELSNAPSCDNLSTGQISFNLIGGTPNYTVVWSNGVVGINVTNLPAGIVTATVSDANGCIANYNGIVNEEKCLVTLIPQLLSPNGDSKNEQFYINTINYFPNNKLEIYNRWGNLVYSKEKYDNSFNGQPNVSNAIGNGLLPAGTYFVVFDFGDGKIPPYKGYLEVRY